MSFRARLCALVPGVVLGVLGPASAQTPASINSGRSVISGGGGLSATGSATGASVGGAITFALNERLAIETSGTYLDRGAGADAMSVGANLIVNLRRPTAKALPYAAIGGGLYRARFDLGTARFFGTMGTQYSAGTMMIPLQGGMGFGMMGAGYSGASSWNGQMWDTRAQGAWPGAVYAPQHMPSFYVNRLGPMTVPTGGRWGMRTFTDPALTLGGGVRLDLGRHLSVRPDARALVVIGGGDTYTTAIVSFNVGYRF